MTFWVQGASSHIDALSQWRPIVAVCNTFTVLMVMVVSVRFWVRRHQFYAEDGIILITAIFGILFNVGTVVQTRYGLGLPLRLRPVSSFHKFIVWNYAIRPFYLWGIAGFKLALCMSYLRMTHGTTDRRYRIFVFTVAVFSVFAQTVFVFLNLFSCSPLAKVFNPKLHGYCLPYGPVNYTISATTILCDVVIFLTPIPLINKLKLDRAVRLGLTLIFSLGLFTTLCSILRMTQVWRIAFGDGNSSMLVMYSALEINVGIITSCLPVLRPLLKHIPRKVLSLLLSSTRGRTADSSGREGNSYIASDPQSNRSQEQGKSTRPGERKSPVAHRMFSANGIERVTTTLGGGGSEEDMIELGTNEEPARKWDGVGVTRTVEVDIESNSSLEDMRRQAKRDEW